MVIVAGIDVGKVSQEVWAGDGPAQRFDSSTLGIAALVEWLKGQGVSVAVCEPTGGYDRQLISQLEEAGLSADMVHPNSDLKILDIHIDFARGDIGGAQGDMKVPDQGRG